MAKYKVEVEGAEEAAKAHPVEHEPAAETETASSAQPAAASAGSSVSDATALVATVGVVVVGAALLEAALIPGILVGVAAALAPQHLPKLGERLQPLFDSTVKGAVKLGRRAQTSMSEARERFHDMAAEVTAEEAAKVEDAAAAA